MKCLRCGYCCIHYCVVIVDDPEKGLREDNVLFHGTSEVPEKCKHLLGDKPGEYSCALHDKKWYKRTPCFAHGQIEEHKDDPCRMGDYILNKKG